MKKLLFIVAMMWSFAYGQTYLPSLHTVTNKALGIAQANPTDARSYYYDQSLFKYRPYQSTAEVLAYLNLAKYRTGQFPIFINSGGTLNPDGTFSGGIILEYWFKNGTTDPDLIIKSSVLDSDTLIWNTAYRKRPVSLVYDSLTRIASLTLGDGSVLFDTITTQLPESVTLGNGSSTVGDTLLVSNVGGDTAWVKNILGGSGILIEAMGDTVLKVNSDSSTAFNIYNSDGTITGNRTVTITGDLLFTVDGVSSAAMQHTGSGTESIVYVEDNEFGVFVDSLGYRAGMYSKRIGNERPNLQIYAAKGLFIKDKAIIDNIDSIMPYYGSSDTSMYWNPSTGQVQRSTTGRNVTTKANSTNATIALTDNFVILSDLTGASARTVTMPTGATGKQITIINKSSDGALKWTFASTVTDISGATVTAIDDLSSYTLLYDGANWIIINKY